MLLDRYLLSLDAYCTVLGDLAGAEWEVALFPFSESRAWPLFLPFLFVLFLDLFGLYYPRKQLELS